MYQVTWPDGTVLRAGLRVGDPWTFTLDESRWGEIQGLLGNANGDRTDDLVARNAAPFDYNTLELYEIFGASWLLNDDTSFFESTLAAIDRLPIVPSAIITIADLPPDDVAEAERLCRNAGIQPGAGLAECIFDVALTQDVRWITGINIVDDIVAQSISVLAEEGLIEDQATATAPGVIQGTIDTPGSFDLYTIPLQAGSSVAIAANDECTSRAGFEFALEAPGGYFVGRSSGSDCGFIALSDLPETGDYVLRVYDTAGFTGSYGLETFLPEAGTSRVELDVPQQGTIETPQGEDFFDFTVPGGLAGVFVDFGACFGGGGARLDLIWEVLDAGDAVVGSGNCAFDRELAGIAPGDYTMRLFSDGATTGDYTFELRSIAV